VGHFDGTMKKPVTAAPVHSTLDKQEKIDEWENDEHTMLYMLSKKLLHSAVVCVHKAWDPWRQMEVNSRQVY